MGTTAIAAPPNQAVAWAARLLALAVSLFLAAFALDSVDRRPLAAMLPALLIHLIPAALVMGFMAVSWRREWIGALAFTGMAAAYAIATIGHPSWIAVISGPLLVTGVFYGWSWKRRRAGL